MILLRTGLRGAEEFLARRRSLGPDEVKTADFASHEAADLDVKFLIALIKRSHRLARLVCVPAFTLYATTRGDGRVVPQAVREGRPPPLPHPPGALYLRAGVAVTHARDPARRRLWLPPDLAGVVARCAAQRKRFVVCNFGVYAEDDLANGHANSLLFDLDTRCVERYDPLPPRQTHGLDAYLRTQFRTHLPDWTYHGTRFSRNGVQTPDTDSYGGMCVTFSLLYVLLRLLNPDRPPREVHAYLLAHKRSGTLRDEILHLNRHVADTLRTFPTGSLVRGSRSRARSRARE